MIGELKFSPYLLGMKPTLTVLLLAIALIGYSQEKIEVEERIKKKDVPANALAWIEKTFDLNKRVKWYFEETSGKISYEAKFYYDYQKYSVEFSSDGTIEDVEIVYRLSELDPEDKKSLTKALNKIRKSKINKIQLQYSGHPELVSRSFRKGFFNAVEKKYEVEFYGELEGKHAFWEGTFTAWGELINYREIILPPTDHLIF